MHVHVLADHFSLVAAVYVAVSVEPLLKYVHEVSHELMEEKLASDDLSLCNLELKGSP